MDHAITAGVEWFAESVSRERRSRHLALQILVLGFVGDALAVLLALIGGFWIRFETPLVYRDFESLGINASDYTGHAVFGAALFVLLLAHFRLYDPSILLRMRQVTLIIFKAALVWLVAYTSLAAIFRLEEQFSRIFLAIAFVGATSTVLAWRAALHWVISSESIANSIRQRILFVGWSENANALARAILKDRRHPYEIVGCVPSAEGRYHTEPPGEIQRLGGYDTIENVILPGKVEIVIVADTNPPDGEIIALANRCEKDLISFKMIPSCFEILQLGLNLETVSGVPVIGISRLPMDSPLSIFLKRSLDVLGGIVGIILTAPLVAIFGALVYLESPGPIIYRQRRVGREGRVFWIYKIRSMKPSSESAVGWTVKDDPRRLRIGAFMRRWNIDEVPQFWNVLTGEMSLVGPRPEVIEWIRTFREEVPHYNARHAIKPGITGWAQVNGLRGDTDIGERIRCDLYYIENWSVLLDMQIMAMTLFKRENAG